MKKIILIAAGLVFLAAACNQKNAARVMWDFDLDQNQWVAEGPVPDCPPLEFDSPVNASQVTSVLYPGQFRGEDGNYRAHGGFRFDNQTTTEVSVRAPFDAYVFRGSRYLVNGEIQYVFDFINPCGIMYRFGHLLELAPALQTLAEKFPPPQERDSRDHRTENIFFNKGDLIATKVGLPGNVFVDWGVYDLRVRNLPAQTAEYRAKHGWMAQHAFYGICWLDYLPGNEQSAIKNLPGGDYKVGKQSDYCQ